MLHHKFHAKKTEFDGIRFDSKLEATYYKKLKSLQDEDKVLFFLRQIPFHLPGNITYRADFMVFFTDGHVEIWEIKGYETKDWIMRKKLVEATYPIEITVLK